MHADDQPPGAPDDTRRRMRDSLRRNAARARDAAATGLRRGAPHAFVAALVAAALAPVAGAAVGGAAAAGVVGAALAQVGQVGAGYLVEAVLEVRRRLAGRAEPPDDDAVADALAAELERRLAVGDDAAAALRREMSGLLQAVDAVGVLLDDRLGDVRDDLARGLLDAARRDEEFGWLVGGVDERVRAVQEQLSRMEAADRQRAATTERSLVTLALLRADVQRLLRRDDAVPVPDPLPHSGSVAEPGDCPYPGLAPFRTQDAAWFRGRDELVARLVARLAAGVSPVVVLGASGAGKSSLLAAGLLPALLAGALPEPGSADRPHVVLTPGRHPVDALAAAVAVLTGAEAGALASGLRAEPDRLRASLLQAAAAGRPAGAAAVTGPGGRREAVVVVDQLEELFTMCDDEAQRQAFLDALAAATGVAHVVLGVRADFYADCARYPFLRDALATSTVHVGPMTPDELRVAVTAPAADTGWLLEPGLVDLLLADLGGRPGRPYPAGALPLLAHALRGTWLRREGRTLTVAGYRATGGLDGAVAATAEAVHDALDEPGRTALRHLATALVDDTATGEHARRRLPVADALRAAGGGPVAAGVLDRLVAARLVTTTSAGDDGGTVELTHEAVVGAWPRLRTWLDEDAGARRERRALEAAAAEWERVGRDDGALLRGSRLVAALGVVEDPVRRARLTDGELALVAASVAARDAGQQRARRRTRRLAVLAAGLAVLTVVSVGTTVVAVRSRGTAQQQRVDAVSRQLAAEAVASRTTEPRRAKLLALAAWRTARTAEARGALLSLQAQPYAGEFATGSAGVRSMAMSPDGQVVAILGTSGVVELREVPGGRLVRTLPGAVDEGQRVAFTADGRYVVAGGYGKDPTGWLVWWDAATGRRVGFFAVSPVATIATGPDPDLVAVATFQGEDRKKRRKGGFLVRFLSLSQRRVVTVSPVLGRRPVMSTAMSPDGRTLAVGTDDGTIRLLATADGRVVSTFAQDAGVSALAWAPDGRTLYSSGTARAVRQWDPVRGVPAGAPLRRRDLVPATYAALAPSPDGTQVVAVGSSIDRWKVAGEVDLEPWRTRLTVSTAAAWTPDGRYLLVGSSDGRVSRWAAAVRADPFFDIGVLSVAVSPDGRLVAETGAQGVVRVRSVADGRLVRSLTTRGGAGPVAFSADGRTVFAGDSRSAVLGWDVATGRQTLSVDVSRGLSRWRGPEDLAVSPDGRTLAVVTASDEITEGGIGRPGIADVLVLVDLATGRVGGDVTDPFRSTDSVGWTADGRHVVAGLDSHDAAAASLRTYDASTGALVAEHVLPAGLSELRVSRDGRTAVVAGRDGRLRSFSLSEDGRSIRPLRDIAASADQPLRVAGVSADGSTAAVAAARDPRVLLWDLRTGRQTAVITFHTDVLARVDFGPDGRTLATASADAWAVTWLLDPAAVERGLCSDVTGPDVRDEWRQIVGRSKDAVRFPC